MELLKFILYYTIAKTLVDRSEKIYFDLKEMIKTSRKIRKLKKKVI